MMGQFAFGFDLHKHAHRQKTPSSYGVATDLPVLPQYPQCSYWSPPGAIDPVLLVAAQCC